MTGLTVDRFSKIRKPVVRLPSWKLVGRGDVGKHENQEVWRVKSHNSQPPRPLHRQTLLKEAGYTHLLDWPMDDQPLWMRTRSGPILSVPYPLELNDAGTLIHRAHSGREFADMLVDQFEEMLQQSERQPLVFGASLHGFIVGQPFRLRPLRQALKHCVEHKNRDRVWFTRAGDIANYCFKMPPGVVLGS